MATHPQDPFETSVAHETLEENDKRRKREEVEEKEGGNENENGMIRMLLLASLSEGSKFSFTTPI